VKQLFRVLFSVTIIIFLTSNCARKGRPSGGLKDSIAPLMITAKPPYKSINFNSKKIELSFDEYVTLKNINQQLVISPPLKYLPIITPQSSPSKKITIKLTDTLKPNTTYTLNFGNSIQDNNEGNKLERFKYLFSTGSYIDSLKIRGTILDAYNKEFNKNINVLLYKVDSTFNDSIVYKQKPNYVTSTLDTTLFNITNIQKGRYLLVALKDNANNYLFNPNEDKIGFYSRHIELPKDSIIDEPIYLFKEIKNNKFYFPKQISKGKIQFGFDGKRDSIRIDLLSQVPSTFKSTTLFEPKRDTLNFWHSPIENDSLVFKLSNQKVVDTVVVFLRSKIVDSLKVNSNVTSVLDLKDTITFTSNNPITNIDKTKITLLDKDTINVEFSYLTEKKSNKIKLLFDKQYNQNYKLTIFPKAFSDILNTANDTLKYSFTTKEPEDYGSIELSVTKRNSSPVIIELLTESNKEVIRRKTITQTTTVNFDLLPAGRYIVRGIIDTNKNGKWDTGSYLKKNEPEKVIYLPISFNVRANWHFPESFTIN
jgi:uncharacterized protein (DUF2141 family)